MTINQFIEKVAKYVQQYAPKYDIKVASPIIAQAILESAGGTSELAKNANNYFGLKYKNGRCPTALNNPYYKEGSEQNADGSYASSVMQWFQFKNLEQCIIGYFDFINISRYSNLKGITDPKKYLELIKEDGYATSLQYVDNLYRVIQTYDLTKYDTIKEENNMAYTNSPLTTYAKISPNKTSPRNHAIDTITIHCFVGQVTAQSGCNAKSFVNYNPLTGASCNYVVGYDGSIGLCVPESDRSWCSSNKANDHRAITIEVASETVAPYKVTDKALVALIQLCADICRRNNIKKLVWSTNKNERVNHLNGCNMTVHRDYKNKACPGEYLYERHGYIADEVNKLLGFKTPTSTSTTTTSSTRSYLMKGDKSEEVRVLQENLNYLGYSCGNADGIFGAKTETALKKFQKEYALTTDGKYGTMSKQMMEKVVANKKNNISSAKKFAHNNLDYSLVFDPTYYSNAYSDLKRHFGNDATKLFEHFIDYGRIEGRQAISTFNPVVYKNRYPDLQQAFGSNMSSYYDHYIMYGFKEKRKGI